MRAFSHILLALSGLIVVLHGMTPHEHHTDRNASGVSILFSATTEVDFLMLNAGADHLENSLPRSAGSEVPAAVVLDLIIPLIAVFLALSFILSRGVFQRQNEAIRTLLFLGHRPGVILRPPPVL